MAISTTKTPTLAASTHFTETGDCCSPTMLSGDSEAGCFQELGESLYLTPGESLSYTTQVLNTGFIRINRLLDDGMTFETETNSCLKPDQAVHLFYGEGFCASTDLDSCLYVGTTPTDNSFTLKNKADAAHIFKPTAIINPDTSKPGRAVTAWIAEAGDLSGYRVRLRLVLGDARSPRLLSVGAIKAKTKQLQLKGVIEDIGTNDRITLGDGPDSYTGTVISANVATFKNVCYTVCQMEQAAVADIPFTSNILAHLDPYQHIIEATAPALDCGWASVTIPGNLTRSLIRYKKHPVAQVLVGSWDFSLIWGESGTGPEGLPAHIASDYSNAYWLNVFDKGALYV